MRSSDVFVRYTLCDAIGLKLIIKSREKRINSLADVNLEVSELRDGYRDWLRMWSKMRN